jgi:tryptophan halogenase
MQAVFEDVRDFIVLHYKATRRDDSDFWNYCRTMDVPDSLASKLDLWRSKGRIFRDGQELFGPASWVALLLGQGVVPEEQDPAVMGIDAAMAADLIDKMHESYRRMAEHMPAHADFIAQACAAAKAEAVA